jgi:hypothetical protein
MNTKQRPVDNHVRVSQARKGLVGKLGDIRVIYPFTAHDLAHQVPVLRTL